MEEIGKKAVSERCSEESTNAWSIQRTGICPSLTTSSIPSPTLPVVRSGRCPCGITIKLQSARMCAHPKPVSGSTQRSDPQRSTPDDPVASAGSPVRTSKQENSHSPSLQMQGQEKCFDVTPPPFALPHRDTGLQRLPPVCACGHYFLFCFFGVYQGKSQV